MSDKEKIRDLISKGKTKEAITFFFENLSPADNEYRDNLTLINGKLSKINDDLNVNLISAADYNVELARIEKATLSFSDSYFSSDSTSLLDKIILELPISKDAELGVLTLVNCDRIVLVRKFNRSFEDKKELKQPFQFYFLCGCPDEKPDSIAERVVYEIIEKEGLDLSSSVSYPFLEEDFKRLKVENLPLGIDVAGSRKKLKEYVQKRFAFTNAESFETFIETGIPKLPYNYIFTVFKITETDWEDAEDDIFVYLQWMMDTFKTASPKVPTFLFMFVVQFKNLYDATKVNQKNVAIMEKIKLFCDKNTSAILSDIAPIKTMHFTDWLDKLGVDIKYANELVDVFTTTLNVKDRFEIEGETRFHMKDIEPLQKKIVETFRNKP